MHKKSIIKKKHLGKWVAMVDGKVIGTHNDLKILREVTGDIKDVSYAIFPKGAYA